MYEYRGDIENPIPRKFKVGRSKSGLGLFATEIIKKGERIVEYIGYVLNDAEVDKKKHTKYLFDVRKNKTIDGSPRWNVARYANHSCEPNAESVEERRGARIFLEAIRTIHPDEEITFDYGEEYVAEHITPYGCRCEKCMRKKDLEKGV